MKRLIKYVPLLIVLFQVAFFSLCFSQNNIIKERYRYVSFQKVPRDQQGKAAGNSYWKGNPTYIKGLVADSFYMYSKYDSIKFMPPGSPSPSIFKKTQIKAKSWKAKSRYGDLIFVGNYIADHLRGMHISFYMAKDRSTILQVNYLNPGYLADALLFHKDNINVLKKQAIVVEAKDEESEAEEIDVTF